VLSIGSLYVHIVYIGGCLSAHGPNDLSLREESVTDFILWTAHRKSISGLLRAAGRFFFGIKFLSPWRVWKLIPAQDESLPTTFDVEEDGSLLRIPPSGDSVTVDYDSETKEEVLLLLLVKEIASPPSENN
jgi:hypothetical protein